MSWLVGGLIGMNGYLSIGIGNDEDLLHLVINDYSFEPNLRSGAGHQS